MSPFIKDGDKLTIVPYSQVTPRIGDLVACTCSQSQKLIVYRFVSSDGMSFLLKGNNSFMQPDGWFSKEQIIGVVTRLQRGGKTIKFGIGVERGLIANLSKKGLLTRIINRLRRIIRL